MIDFGVDVVETPEVAQIKKMERSVKIRGQRIEDLELALSETKKRTQILDDILSSLQWEPDVDYYVYKNPRITDRSLIDMQENKIQEVIMKMRQLERAIGERDEAVKSITASQALQNPNAKSQGVSRGSPSGMGTPKLNQSARAPASPAPVGGVSHTPQEGMKTSKGITKNGVKSSGLWESTSLYVSLGAGDEDPEPVASSANLKKSKGKAVELESY